MHATIVNRFSTMVNRETVWASAQQVNNIRIYIHVMLIQLDIDNFPIIKRTLNFTIVVYRLYHQLPTEVRDLNRLLRKIKKKR
jgi:hypothetical protein